MATYTEKFAAKLSARLGASFEVRDLGGDLIAARYLDTSGSLAGHVPSHIDRRKPVQDADILEWIRSATASARRHLPHYTESAAADARAMLAELERGA